MHKQTQEFGTLRALLHRTPSADDVPELMELLNTAKAQDPERFAEEWTPYLLDHMTRWYEALPVRTWWDDDDELCWEDPFGMVSGAAAEAFDADAGALEVVRTLSISESNQQALLSRQEPLPHLRMLWSHSVDAAALAGWPSLQKIELLSLAAGGGVEPLAALLHSPHMSDSLATLILQYASLAGGLDAVCSWSGWAKLEQLALTDIRGSEEDGLALLGVLSPSLNTLVMSNVFAPHTTSLVAGASTLEGVAQLTLYDEILQDATQAEQSLAALAASPIARKLRSLNMNVCEIGGHLDALFSQGTFPKLTAISLGACSLSHESFTCLLAWMKDSALEELVLNENYVLRSAIPELMDSAPESLRALSVSDCWLDDSTLTALAAWPGLARLDTLDLQYNSGLSEEGITALLDSPHLRDETELYLSWEDLSQPLQDRLGARPSGLLPFYEEDDEPIVFQDVYY